MTHYTDPYPVIPSGVVYKPDIRMTALQNKNKIHPISSYHNNKWNRKPGNCIFLPPCDAIMGQRCNFCFTAASLQYLPEGAGYRVIILEFQRYYLKVRVIILVSHVALGTP